LQRLLLVLGITSLLAIGAAGARAADAGAAPGCGTSYGGNGYAYAGFQAGHKAHGVRATLSSLGTNDVAEGHIAAWVGVGGPGQGPGGANEWLQVGLSSFPGSAGNLYYELTRPGSSPQFRLLESAVPVGELRRVSVLEMGSKPNWWRVWVDGKPASDPVFLPGSTNRWEPIATAEAWDGGAGVCNSFSYRFDRIELASAPGGSWHTFQTGFRFQDDGYRVSLQSGRPGTRSSAGVGGTSFVATAA